jgi:hypothetical protein
MMSIIRAAPTGEIAERRLLAPPPSTRVESWRRCREDRPTSRAINEQRRRINYGGSDGVAAEDFTVFAIS